MRSGGIFILVLIAWMLMGLWAFSKARNKSKDAIQTATFIVVYPIALVVLFQLKPMPPVIALPLVMCGIPWLGAGSHLKKVTADPSATRPGDFIGLPYKFWGWGLFLSVAIGVLAG